LVREARLAREPLDVSQWILTKSEEGCSNNRLEPIFFDFLLHLRSIPKEAPDARVQGLPGPRGSRLGTRVSIVQAEDVPPDALRVTYNLSIEIECGKRPACVSEVISQHYR
jgi:hypothetical protein